MEHSAHEERERFDEAWEAWTAALRKARSRAADNSDGLTPAQFRLLAALEGGTTSLSVGELAQAAGVSSPTATRMLDGLEECGIVKREPVPGDRRRTAVRPTAKGRTALAEARARADAFREQIFGQLPAGDRDQAARLLLRLADVLEHL